jgi:hypothetical protein
MGVGEDGNMPLTTGARRGARYSLRSHRPEYLLEGWNSLKKRVKRARSSMDFSKRLSEGSIKAKFDGSVPKSRGSLAGIEFRSVNWNNPERQ